MRCFCRRLLSVSTASAKSRCLLKVFLVIVFCSLVFIVVKSFSDNIECTIRTLSESRDDEIYKLKVRNKLFESKRIPNGIDMEVEGITSALWTDGCRTPKNETTLPKPCQSPRKKFMFVKTHKCASTTVSALLLRYAIRHNLTVATPKFELGHIGWPSPFRPEAIYGYPLITKFDALAHHVLYDRCYVKKMFPKNLFTYITILRDPFVQFKSSVSYFNEMNHILPKTADRYRIFLENPDQFEQHVNFTFSSVFFGTKSVTRNMMATDLGFPYAMYDNETAVNLFLERTSQDFDLVMITEYFVESLVLLKRLMCWRTEDVLYMHLNANKHVNVSKADDLRWKHEQYSAVDYKLYEHFNSTFWRKVAEAGPGFFEEVNALKRIVQDVSAFCKQEVRKVFNMYATEFNTNFTVTRADCTMYKISPDQHTAPLWNKLSVELAKTTPWI